MSGLELAAPAAPAKNLPSLRFEGGEHTAIGDDTLLRFAKDARRLPPDSSSCICPTAWR